MIIKACAKLNYALNIESARSDGYHNLQMIMQTVDLCDTIKAHFAENTPLNVTCNPTIEGENLVTKAVELYSQEIGKNIGGSIHIEKRIPLCSGLGGGSADAAAVLLALQKQYGGVSEDRLMELALKLGADVPFAVVGGTKYALGVGENLADLPTETGYCILLASAGEKDSTGKMFARFDAMENKLQPEIEAVAKLLEKGDFKSALKMFKNSFYPLYQGELPQKIDRILKENGAVCVSLSGAGPTVFGIFETAEQAHAASAVLSEFTWTALCRPTEKSIYFE